MFEVSEWEIRPAMMVTRDGDQTPKSFSNCKISRDMRIHRAQAVEGYDNSKLRMNQRLTPFFHISHDEHQEIPAI